MKKLNCSSLGKFPNFTIMGIKKFIKYHLQNTKGFIVFPIISSFCYGQTEKKGSPPNLAEVFSASKELPLNQAKDLEVEPIVVGRKKWSDPPSQVNEPAQSKVISDKNLKKANIQELDPLETRQGQFSPKELPLTPPTIPPAVNLHRNFEGKLVLKTRKFGFEKIFPFQLENSRGKRLAYIDFQNIRSADPISLKNKNVNILGKLESIKEGSDDLVIRAKILREIE